MDAIETIEVNGFTVELHHDENPLNPREEFDNLSTMICFHSRYSLGDKHDCLSGDFTGWDGLKKQIIREHRPVVILPLFLMDHSGLTISTDPERFRAFDSAGWDWGQVGFVFVSRANALKEYGKKRISKRIREQAEKVLPAEVETYGEYLGGAVYGYIVKDADGEVLDSCWGFFGLDYARREAEEAAKHEIAS